MEQAARAVGNDIKTGFLISSNRKNTLEGQRGSFIKEKAERKPFHGVLKGRVFVSEIQRRELFMIDSDRVSRRIKPSLNDRDVV